MESNMKMVKVILSLGVVLSSLGHIELTAQDFQTPNTEESKEKESSKDGVDEEYSEEEKKKFNYSIEGEIHYNDIVQDANNSNVRGELDFHKLAMKSGYYISDHWSLTGKVIVEHSFDSEYAGGDVFLHNLYAKYKHSKKLAIQAGMISVPISGGKNGFFGSVELSPVEKYLSYAWREAGIGLTGSLNNYVNYRVTLTTGLDPYELSSKFVIYSARNHQFSNSLNNLATGLQVYFHNHHGSKIGFSTLYSGLKYSGETFETFRSSNYTFAEVFGYTKFGYVGTRFVINYSKINGVEAINNVFHNKVGSAQAGSLFEFSYDISRYLKNNSQKLFTVLRAEYYDSQYRTVGDTDNSKYEHYDFTVGLVYRLARLFEIKADYQIQRFGSTYSSQLFDMSIGFKL